MQITDLAIRRPVFAVMLVAAFVGFGAVSFSRIGVDLFHGGVDQPSQCQCV